MTFDELFAEHNLTPEERAALVMHLAVCRAMATLRALTGALSPQMSLDGGKDIPL